MNNLSWLLYWADVLPKVSTWVCIIFFIMTVIGGLTLILGITGFFGDESKGTAFLKGKEAAIAEGHTNYRDYYKDEVYAVALAPRFRAIGGFLFPAALLLWGASFLVPEKETFYLIAASQAGEQAMQAPEFGKLRTILNQFLDSQIKKDKEPEKETE